MNSWYNGQSKKNYDSHVFTILFDYPTIFIVS